jgi:conjugative relaxase-like TrwC/TraI family protein
MLRIIQNNSAAGAKSYYASADYYTQGQELEGQWRGKGAAMLGLRGEINGVAGKLQWERLCDNQHPITGQKLMPRTKEERRIGYDLNFHAPKSLSVFYSLTQDERVLQAFREAVDTTMSDMEQEMQTRVRVGGQNTDRTTGNLVYGEFVHTTARPVGGVPDPHLHAHCFAFNTTFDKEEQRWKAGQFAGLKRDAPYFEAVFHAELAHRMEKLGLPVRRTKQGWELADVPQTLIRKFSRRTQQIEQEALDKGVSNPKDKDKLGAKTRERKVKHLSPGELQSEWKNRCTLEESDALKTATTRLDEHEALRQHAKRDGRTHTERQLALQSRIPEAAREAVQLAMDHCFERSAVVPEREVLARALKLGVGQTDRNAVLDAAARSEMISRDLDGRRMVTTREVLAEERAMLDFARSGRGACSPLGSSQDKPTRDFLSEEQQQAMQHVLASKDRVIIVRGTAGTGKTTLMQETIHAIEKHGRQVFTFAPSAGASHGVLKEAGFANADTVAMLLENPQTQERMRDNVIWIDETGLLGAKATRRVFDIAQSMNARVILSGDKRQHSSVERGGTLQLLEREAGLIPAELREVRRQSGAYKQSVMALSEGKVIEGFTRLDELGWVKEIADRETRLHTLANAYVQSAEEKAKGKGTTLVVCPTHREAEAVTDEIRSKLKSKQMLSKDEREFVKLQAVSMTEAERRDPLNYQDGDVLVFHKHAPGIRKGCKVTFDKAHADTRGNPLRYADRFTVFRPSTIEVAVGDRLRITKNRAPKRGQHGPKNIRLNNGDLLTVKGMTANGDLELSNGARLGKDYGHIDYGYVVTSHASQGKSVDRVIVAQSSESFRASSREQFYVSVSRGKKQALIVTDDKHALREAVQQGDTRMTATELIATRVPQRIAKARSQTGKHTRGPEAVRRPTRATRLVVATDTHQQVRHREGMSHER